MVSIQTNEVGSAAFGQLPPVLPSDEIKQIEEFFHILFDGAPKGVPLYLNIASNGDWKGDFFSWPDQVEAAGKRALAWDAEGYDAFFCVALMTARDRKEQYAAAVHSLWCETDDEKATANIANGPQPTVIVGSSPGHAHAYYRLSNAIEPAKAKELNRRLAYALGADKSGYDLAQLLRVPFTHNRKPERTEAGKAPAVTIRKKSGFVHEVIDLENAIPPVATLQPRFRFDSNEPPVKALSKSGLDLWYGRNAIRKAQGDDSIDRSETLYAIGSELAKAGMTCSGIIMALRDRDVALGFNKYTDRPERYEIIARKVLAEIDLPFTAPSLLRSSREVNQNPSPPAQCLVEKLFLLRQVGIICGPTYAGKSLFAMDVAVSLAAGKNVVGHPDLVIPRNFGVAYVYAEQGHEQWEGRMFAIERHKSVQSPGDIPLYLRSGYDLNMGDAEHRKAFIAELRNSGVEVCVFDPLAVIFRPEDENDVAKVVAAVRDPLQEFVRAGITPIAVHHSSKRALDHQPYDALELVRGSSDISAMSGSIIGVWDGKKAGTKIIARVRGQSVRPFRVDKKTVSALPLTRPHPESLEQMMDEAGRVLDYAGPWEKPEGSTEEAILDHLREHGSSTSKQIAAAIGQARRTVQDCTKNLRETGQIQTVKRGKDSLHSLTEPLGKAA